ncbi:nucleoporin 62 like [Gadus macrocephalus]|uniref:nucleoporin 62 like n=1 Tax=Gadus macrocephalus TaxID=80720 RepID=UPI0028CBC072|nr:nucleoporin 62 like [Gadus macrocephalus]
MSGGGFSFGQSAAGGFGSFGAQKPAQTAAPATAFGMATSTPAAAGGGFSFATASPAQPVQSNPAGGFSFGTPAKSTAGGGGGFSFGTPTPTPAFSLTATPQPAATGLTMGTTTAAPAQGFSLGGGLTAQSTMAAPAGGGFSFGAAVQPQMQAQMQPQMQAQMQAQMQPQMQAQMQPQMQAQMQPQMQAQMQSQMQAQMQPQMQAPMQAQAPAAAAPGGLGLGGFSFGSAKVQMTTASATPPAAAGGGFSFGNAAASTLSMGVQPTLAAAPTVAAAPMQGGGGFSFGIKPSSTPAPASIAPATQAAPTLSSSLFSMPIPTSTPNPAATGFSLGGAVATAASVAPTATTGGLGVMLKPLGAATVAPTPVATSAAVAAPITGIATGFSLGSIKPTSIASGVASLATATAVAAAAMPPAMSYAQLESLINKWSLELEDQERHFLQQATQVNAWDRTLVENGEKITSLHKEMEKVKLDQRRLNQELDFILSQQKELEDLLSPLEDSVREQSGTIYMQNADEEREKTYKLAENVDAQLKRMSQDLKEIIEHLNTSSGPSDTSDPLQQICKILNAHMDSLQWVDQNSVLLQRRVEDVSKLCDNTRKEQEKTFRLTFD